LITRHITIELLKILTVTLVSLTFLMILVGVAAQAIRDGLGMMAIVRLIPFMLPNALVFALPGTLLFSTCSVYGRMSASNEIVALKSMGISPMGVIWPSLVLAFLLSLLGVWLVDMAFTWGHQGIRRVVLESIEEIAYGVLRTRHAYSDKRFSIHVRNVWGRRLIEPTISLRKGDDRSTVTIVAEEAKFQQKPGQNALRILLTNGILEMGQDVRMTFPDTIEYLIPLGDADDGTGPNTNPSHIPLRRIAAETVAQKQRIDRSQRTLAVEAACDMMTGDFTALERGRGAKRLRQLADQRHRLHRLYAEPWRRWASGFSCFCFALVGVPLAIRLRTSDIMTTFGLCFLPILILYYPLFAFSLDRAKQGALPPFTIWAGNVVCIGVGVWLVRTVVRH
jgi:lipopolysaccharide export system permease protein